MPRPASTGARVWKSSYAAFPGQANFPTAMALSPDGSTVFVTGQTYSSAQNTTYYATVALRAATGTMVWEELYRGARPGHLFAEPYAVAVSRDGSAVFVTGDGPGRSRYVCATVAYRAGTGARLWADRYDSAGLGAGCVSAATSPTRGIVYVAGGAGAANSKEAYLTIAYRG